MNFLNCDRINSLPIFVFFEVQSISSSCAPVRSNPVPFKSKIHTKEE